MGIPYSKPDGIADAPVMHQYCAEVCHREVVMAHRARALALVALVAPLAMGCARTTHDQQVAASPPTVLAMPAPDQPRITASGVVDKYDEATGIVSFTDGHKVQLTSESRILQTGVAPGLRPGAHVVVQNA